MRWREQASRAWRRLRGGQLSPRRAAGSVGTGLFIGCLPVYGLHLPLCFAVCLPLRLDTVVAYLAANISNPLVAPFLVVAEVELGSLLLTGEHAAFDVERARAVGLAGFAAQAAVGSVVLGLVLGGIGAALAAWLAGRARGAVRPRQAASATAAEPDRTEAALERTIARYRSAPVGDRFYVAIKLHTDPVVKQLAGISADRSFGRVADAGAGRGQLSLFLVELGVATSVYGFDFDERKVRVAAEAARVGEPGGSLASATELEYLRDDLLSAEYPEADTVLLIDVLHYLKHAEQDALLAIAAARLAPGGRILVREIDAVDGGRAKLTQLFERIARRVGFNRARQMHFRASSELVARLEQLGFFCRTLREEKRRLANVLIVAERDAAQAHSDSSAPRSMPTKTSPSS